MLPSDSAAGDFKHADAAVLMHGYECECECASWRIVVGGGLESGYVYVGGPAADDDDGIALRIAPMPRWTRIRMMSTTWGTYRRQTREGKRTE